MVFFFLCFRREVWVGFCIRLLLKYLRWFVPTSLLLEEMLSSPTAWRSVCSWRTLTRTRLIHAQSHTQTHTHSTHHVCSFMLMLCALQAQCLINVSGDAVVFIQESELESTSVQTQSATTHTSNGGEGTWTRIHTPTNSQVTEF